MKRKWSQEFHDSPSHQVMRMKKRMQSNNLNIRYFTYALRRPSCLLGWCWVLFRFDRCHIRTETKAKDIFIIDICIAQSQHFVFIFLWSSVNWLIAKINKSHCMHKNATEQCNLIISHLWWSSFGNDTNWFGQLISKNGRLVISASLSLEEEISVGTDSRNTESNR